MSTNKGIMLFCIVVSYAPTSRDSESSAGHVAVVFRDDTDVVRDGYVDSNSPDREAVNDSNHDHVLVSDNVVRAMVSVDPEANDRDDHISQEYLVSDSLRRAIVESVLYRYSLEGNTLSDDERREIVESVVMGNRTRAFNFDEIVDESIGSPLTGPEANNRDVSRSEERENRSLLLVGILIFLAFIIVLQRKSTDIFWCVWCAFFFFFVMLLSHL